MRAAFFSLSFGFLASLASGCYHPDPTNGSFACSPDLGNACPPGFTCGGEGLCVRPGGADLGGGGLDLSAPQDLAVGPRTCDQILAAGDFSNLKALTNLNTASDEGHIAFDSKGKRLLFQRAGVLYASSLSAGLKSPAAPVALTVTGGPTTFNGGSFTTDGNYWFSGTSGTTTSLYAGVPAGTTGFTATAQTDPVATDCAFSDPYFQGNQASTGTGSSAAPTPFFMAYPRSGCSGPSYIVRGVNGLQLGSFYSALNDTSFTTPSLSPLALTLFVTNNASKPVLYVASRSEVQYQFGTAYPLSTAGIGAGTEDRQMIVSSDCSTVYLVSVRAGGAGGGDIYAADVATE